MTAELIRKYSAEDTSYFICGPQVMYKFLREEVAKLDVPARRVRFEVFGQAKDIAVYEGFPTELRDKTFMLTVVRGISEVQIPAKATESIVVALERAGIRIETGCRSGECGFCRTKVLAGNYFVSSRATTLYAPKEMAGERRIRISIMCTHVRRIRCQI